MTSIPTTSSSSENRHAVGKNPPMSVPTSKGAWTHFVISTYDKWTVTFLNGSFFSAAVFDTVNPRTFLPAAMGQGIFDLQISEWSVFTAADALSLFQGNGCASAALPEASLPAVTASTVPAFPMHSWNFSSLYKPSNTTSLSTRAPDCGTAPVLWDALVTAPVYAYDSSSVYFSFDAINYHETSITMGAHVFGTPFSVALWARLDSPFNYLPYVTLFSMYGTNSTDGSPCDEISFAWNNGNLKVSIEIGGNLFTYFTPTYTLPAGSWTHYALAFSKSSVVIYVNGKYFSQLIMNQTIPSSNRTVTVGENPWFGYGSDDHGMRGHIAAFAFAENYNLTANDANTLYLYRNSPQQVCSPSATSSPSSPSSPNVALIAGTSSAAGAVVLISGGGIAWWALRRRNHAAKPAKSAKLLRL